MRCVILTKSQGNQLCHGFRHAADPAAVFDGRILILEFAQPEGAGDIAHQFAKSLVLKQPCFLRCKDHAVCQSRGDEVDEFAADDGEVALHICFVQTFLVLKGFKQKL